VKFIAEKDNKKKVVIANGFYFTEKTKLKNPTQVALAWKKRKSELRRAGWDIHVIDTDLPKGEPVLPPKKEEKPHRIVREFLGKTFVEEEG